MTTLKLARQTRATVVTTATALLVVASVIAVLAVRLWRTRELTFRDVQRQTALARRSGFSVTLSVLPAAPPPATGVCAAFADLIALVDFLAALPRARPAEPSLLLRDKVSVKLMQLAASPDVALELFGRIAAYAQARDTFVWISAVTRDTLRLELDCYERARAAGYTNVGLTVASYNTTAAATAERVLRTGGHVRLVKGQYRGDIADWGRVTANFAAVAERLVGSGTPHTLATHDFGLLRALHRRAPRFAETTQLAFFYSALPFVSSQLKRLPFAVPHKALYMAQGDYLDFAIHNAHRVDASRHLKRAVSSTLRLSH